MYQQFFLNYYEQNKPLVIGNTILTISIFPIEIIALSWLSGMIFMTVRNKNQKNFWFYTSIFFCFFTLIVILYYLSEQMDSFILPALQSSVRKDIYNLTNDKRIGLQEVDNGEMITKLLRVPNYVFLNFMNTVTFIIPLVFSIFFFVCYMFYLHWKVGVGSLVFFIAFGTSYIVYYSYLLKVSNKRFIEENEIMNEFEDVMRNNENILLNNTIDYERDRLFDTEIVFQQTLRSELLQVNNFKLVFILLLIVYMFALIIYSSYLVMKDELVLVKLVVLTTAAILMIRSFTNLIRRCSDSVTEFGPTLGDDRFEQNILKTQIHKGTRDDFIKNMDMEIQNVSFQQGDQKILKNITVHIPFKDNVLIIGEIGAGKSTLMKIISGYFYPTSGKILLDGVDLRDADISYVRKNITMMHQHITLFKRNVMENILYGIDPASEEWHKNSEELKKMTIYPNIERFIHAKDGTKLSGGQKQIVLLLRCYFRRSKILILDEPTANMDPETKKIIMKIMQEMMEERTVICISHDKDLLPLFKTKYRMDKGKLEKIQGEKKTGHWVIF